MEKKVVFENAHRKKHFEFFNTMNHPHFNITANVEISDFLAQIKKQQLPTTYSLVHLLSETANEVKEFRWRVRNNEIIEHSMVHPSFTVPTDEADVFSFCTVTFQSNLNDFIEEAKSVRDAMKTNPSIEDEPGRDDLLFMSAIPWISFTSMQHAMHYHPHDSVPRISWGKFFQQEGKTMMPLSVQAHHALVDGRHMGAFFEKVEQKLRSIGDR
ncbi:chloramphenicol acetyltransferase [Flagellimonas allohymeniacidonis]|uniref:Chloramphenicol acetyltransferase n=1 Tax=Flagellimonas allohymeniacidonis TaxID=2517819 RepID=A0A4Q8QDY6_9FLAO|nr:chloramphenicol acetyltransferase [Allomuricauda hymeniacidonis]TAI48692.1 chloramphenicol acetyltransferase [Allomuricauda hymeniacidonis]